MIRIKVQKKETESTGSLIRRFTKKMQTSGILRKAKRSRYWDRPKSDYVKRKDALKKIAKQKEYEKLRKLGKIKDAFHKKSH